MRAYKCDACGRVFVLKDNPCTDEERIPMDIYVYHDHDVDTCYNICKECAEKILQEMERLHFNQQTKWEFEFAHQSEVHE